MVEASSQDRGAEMWKDVKETVIGGIWGFCVLVYVILLLGKLGLLYYS